MRTAFDLGLAAACVFPGALLAYWFGWVGFAVVMTYGCLALLDLFEIAPVWGPRRPN